MKYSDTKILKILKAIRNKEKLSYKKINALVEQVFKPYVVVEKDPDGWTTCENRFETLDSAVVYMDFRDYGFTMYLYNQDCNNDMADGMYPILIKDNGKYYDRKDCRFVLDIYEWLKCQTEVES
jgi:hypothetical protein